MKIGILNLPDDAGYVFVFSELEDESNNVLEMLQHRVVHEAIIEATGAKSILCFEGKVSIDERVDGRLSTEHEAQVRAMIPDLRGVGSN